ncbi:MAG: RDD family protein [Comamonas sp.]
MHILPGLTLWFQRPFSPLLFTLAFALEAGILAWFLGPARKLSEITKMQDAWWFWIRGSLQGPVSLQMLELTLRHAVTTQQTLVWKEGLSHWMSMETLSALRKTGAVQVEAERPLDLAPAGAWRRLLARMLDLWTIGLPIALLAWLLLVQMPGFALWFQRPFSPWLLTLCLLPLGLLVEAGIFARAGTTPGKALLGVVVMTLDGQRLTGLQYLQRQLGVFWYGHAMGLPLLFLTALASHGLSLQQGAPTPYDTNRFTVRSRRTRQVPLLVFGCIGCVIAALILAQVYLGY